MLRYNGVLFSDGPLEHASVYYYPLVIARHLGFALWLSSSDCPLHMWGLSGWCWLHDDRGIELLAGYEVAAVASWS